MLHIRTASRGAALLSAVALLGGLGLATPARAAGNHTVSAALSGAGTWTAYLECTGTTGDHLSRTATMTPTSIMSLTFETVSFTGVPDGTCSVQAVRSLLPTIAGTASSLTFPVTADVSKALSIDSSLSLSCPAAAPITGTPGVGLPLTASAPSFTGGVVDPVSLGYAWYRSGLAAPVQTGSSAGYRPTAADVGHTLSVVPTGRMIGLSGIAGLLGSVGVATCPAAVSPLVAAGSTSTSPAKPGVTGRPVVGHRITADPSAPPSGARITGYQWYVQRVTRGHERAVRVKIKHAHHKSLRMKERLAGKHVLVGVTYTFADGTQVTVYSKPLKVMKERMKE